MATAFTLTNSAVNSGSAVYLKGAALTWTMGGLTRTTPLTNQFTLAETQVAGFENPKIVVSGVINANSVEPSVITQKLVTDFMRLPYVTSPPTSTYLRISVGDTPVYFVGALSSTTPTTEQTIKVVIESVNLSADAGDSDEGHYIPYTMTLVETA